MMLHLQLMPSDDKKQDWSISQLSHKLLINAPHHSSIELEGAEVCKLIVLTLGVQFHLNCRKSFDLMSRF